MYTDIEKGRHYYTRPENMHLVNQWELCVY